MRQAAPQRGWTFKSRASRVGMISLGRKAGSSVSVMIVKTVNEEDTMTTATIQANRVINRYRTMPHEFEALHGILCMDHGADYADILIVRQFIDSMSIAMRLDAINRGDGDIIGPLFYAQTSRRTTTR